jgi:hypothetical protein
MTLTTGGNVGVGTTTPSVAAGLGLVLNGGASQTRIAFKNTYTGDASTDGIQFALINGTSAFLFQNRESDGTFAWETNGVERMRITSGGFVGINTSNPAYRFQVDGLQNANDIASRNTTTGGVVRLSINDSFGQVGTIGSHPLGFATNDTLRMFINTSGDVGIGTTSPSVRLDVIGGDFRINRGATNSVVTATLETNMSGSSSKNIINFRNLALSSTPMAAIEQFDDGTNVNGTLLFKTNNGGTNAEKMRITSAGNVLIGRTSSTTNASLQVAGAIRVNNNTDKEASTNPGFGMFFAKGASVTGGAGSIAIKSNTGPEAAMYLVTGLTLSPAVRRFYDIVVTLANTTTVVSSGNNNSPATRTYSGLTETLSVSLSGSDTYTIGVTGFGSNEST